MSAYDRMTEIMITTAEQCITPDADASLALVTEQYNNIRNSCLKELERRIELLIYRLYDVKHFAMRAGVEDTVRYAKDDEYFSEQQSKIAALTDEEQSAALFDQALALVKVKDYAAAGELFRQAALLGHVGAQYNYGVSLASGEVGEPDALQACYWYWKASRGGSAKALVNLAIAYRNGTGVKKDWNQMLYFYIHRRPLPGAARGVQHGPQPGRGGQLGEAAADRPPGDGQVHQPGGGRLRPAGSCRRAEPHRPAGRDCAGHHPALMRMARSGRGRLLFTPGSNKFIFASPQKPGINSRWRA